MNINDILETKAASGILEAGGPGSGRRPGFGSGFRDRAMVENRRQKMEDDLGKAGFTRHKNGHDFYHNSFARVHFTSKNASDSDSHYFQYRPARHHDEFTGKKNGQGREDLAKVLTHHQENVKSKGW